VIEVSREFHRPEQVSNGTLLAMAKKLGQGLVDGLLLGSKAADFPRPVKQAVVNLKICGHVDTLTHTLPVSKENASPCGAHPIQPEPSDICSQ
jgi:hypothetical protein